MGNVDMPRITKLKAVPAPEAASGEISRHRTHHETLSPLPDSRVSHTETATPVWHKDNYGFWLLACVMISVVFSVVYRAFA